MLWQQRRAGGLFKQRSGRTSDCGWGGGPAQRKGVVEGLASGLMTPRLFPEAPIGLIKKDSTKLSKVSSRIFGADKVGGGEGLRF